VGAVSRAALQHFVRRHPPARHGPQFPMAAEPVELAVAAEPDVPTRAQDRRRRRRDARKHILVLAEPGTPLGALVDLLVREEPPDLGVVVNVVTLVEVVLAPRA